MDQGLTIIDLHKKEVFTPNPCRLGNFFKINIQLSRFWRVFQKIILDRLGINSLINLILNWLIIDTQTQIQPNNQVKIQQLANTNLNQLVIFMSAYYCCGQPSTPQLVQLLENYQPRNNCSFPKNEHIVHWYSHIVWRRIQGQRLHAYIAFPFIPQTIRTSLFFSVQ